MKEINCEAKIKKKYSKNKKAANALIKIISEVKNIVTIKNLCGYTPDELKFSNLDLLNSIREKKEFSYFECNDYNAPALTIKKNGCKITVHYRRYWASVLSMDYTHVIKIHLLGPEENVKQERETLRNLL